MFEVGQVVVKLAGRDAGKVGVVVEKLDDRYVVIDGQTRRRKVNVSHVDPTNKTVKISGKASTDDVIKALEGLDIKVAKKGAARKPKQEKPTRVRVVKKKPVEEEKPVAKKKAAKKKTAKKAE